LRPQGPHIAGHYSGVYWSTGGGLGSASQEVIKDLRSERGIVANCLRERAVTGRQKTGPTSGPI